MELERHHSQSQHQDRLTGIGAQNVTDRIIHPISGKTVAVDTFHVIPKTLLAWTKAHKISSAKDISWYLLNEERSLAKATAQDSGDARHNNYSLRILENALDWSLGLAVLRILALCQPGKIPKPFDLLATRSGAILVRYSSGRIKELIPA